jgi:hypothetical protein
MASRQRVSLPVATKTDPQTARRHLIANFNVATLDGSSRVPGGLKPNGARNSEKANSCDEHHIAIGR